MSVYVEYTLHAIEIAISSVGLGVFWIFLKKLEHFMKKIDETQFLNMTVIEKRVQFYEKVAPGLNDLFCFYTYVGRWKEITPADVIQLKRELDKQVHVYKPLFTAKFFQKYSTLMELCFKTFVGIGEDAKLCTKTEKRHQALKDHWKPEWDKMFVEVKECPEREYIEKAYEDLMSCFAQELGLKEADK